MDKTERLAAASPILLKDKAYQAIKEAILNEVFKPGQFLSEKVLIDHLGMSKTPIKSALDRLETEGFITVWPKQGILVKELSLQKIKDIYELRIGLELLICRNITGKLTAVECEALENNLAAQEAFMKQDDEIGFTKADADFHLLLCEIAGNGEIYQIMQNYQAHLYRFALTIMRRIPERMSTSYEDHRNIYESIKDGSVENVQELMRKHLIYGLNAHVIQ